MIGARPISTLEAPDLVDLARSDRGPRERSDIARRIWQTCGQVFEYALTVKDSAGQPLLKRNPAKDLRPSAALMPRKKGHYARIDAKELPELLRKIHAYPGTTTRFAIRSCSR